MSNKSSFFIPVLFLLFTGACAFGDAITGVTDAVQSQVAPITQEAMQALAAATESPALPIAPVAPTKSAVPPKPVQKSTAPQPTAATPVVLNGSELPVRTTAHENIYVAPGVPDSFLQSVIGDAAFASQDLMQDEGWSGAPRVSIFVFPSQQVWLQGIAQIGQLPQNEVQCQAQLKGDAWITISGTAHPGVYIYPIQQSSFDMLHMLAHEYTHAIQRQVLGDAVAVPDWFIEGMAEAEGWRIAGQTDARMDQVEHAQVMALLRVAIRRRQLSPLTSISSQQSWQARLERPRAATLEYGESQIAVEYLQQIKGSGAPMEILRATAALNNFNAAFQQVTQMSVQQFQNTFEQSIR